eukprot:gnl/Spiro4/14477_TR7807_c0_g1_i1.p1 gnl/Spiro4/14477_TR7807_c0_g1~~gnl/Spiro4/14477_TR7807_c0_g1_i1.p1  ORF type:complete len:508 (+),score=135.60 gnl/Spiro4/14477_TR7807_c0_g1_i1:47-1525(+)
MNSRPNVVSVNIDPSSTPVTLIVDTSGGSPFQLSPETLHRVVNPESAAVHGIDSILALVNKFEPIMLLAVASSTSGDDGVFYRDFVARCRAASPTLLPKNHHRAVAAFLALKRWPTNETIAWFESFVHAKAVLFEVVLCDANVFTASPPHTLSRTELVRLLLPHVSDMNEQNVKKSLLLCAISSGDVQCAQEVISALSLGTEPTAATTDSSGRGLPWRDVFNFCSVVAMTRQNLAMLELALSLPSFDPSWLHSAAITHACVGGWLPGVQRLIRAGANPATHSGEPVMIARQRNHSQLVDFFRGPECSSETHEAVEAPYLIRFPVRFFACFRPTLKRALANSVLYITDLVALERECFSVAIAAVRATQERYRSLSKYMFVVVRVVSTRNPQTESVRTLNGGQMMIGDVGFESLEQLQTRLAGYPMPPPQRSVLARLAWAHREAPVLVCMMMEFPSGKRPDTRFHWVVRGLDSTALESDRDIGAWDRVTKIFAK